MGSSNTETKEGNRYYIYYRYNPDAGVDGLKNSNSMDAQVEVTYYLSAKEKEYWIQLTSFEVGNKSGISSNHRYQIVEMLKQNPDLKISIEGHLTMWEVQLPTKPYWSL